LLTNPNRTLRKVRPYDGIALFWRMLHQFPNVAGYCRAFIDHVLVTDRAIKAAKADNDVDQARADKAAERMRRAWAQVHNRAIVLACLLMGRFFGYARAEKVWRFDEVVGEWIQDLYDVSQEFWIFDDEDREWLVTTLQPQGTEVDPARFIHFQWGSADTKYGDPDLGYVHTDLWKMQQLEAKALKRIEDNDSVVIVHCPKHIVGAKRTALENAYAEEFDRVIIVPSNEELVRTEMPTLSLSASGAAARPEYEGVAIYETRVQTFLLGAPQTGRKSLGTGKLEDVRQDVWNDKTPIASSSLDQVLTAGWAQSYCAANMADLPPQLRPRFESDTVEVTQGLSGVAAQNATAVAFALGANQITADVAVELWTAIGISQPRARAMAESTVRERAKLAAQPVNPTVTQPVEEAA
jgi:hypothetical protein